MNKVKDRIGEISIASNGMQMKIIAYRNAHDIDIMFEDGSIVRNREYKMFKRGYIGYPKSDRLGEVGVAANGMKMKIINYRSSTDIDVQFEDGIIVRNKTYTQFKTGSIRNPNFYKSGRVGEISTAINGMTIKIIRYNKANDVDIQFEDGTIVKGKQYTSFKKGNIRYPEIRLGETNISNEGMRMKIIVYRKFRDIDVQFEDGTIVKNRTYAEFKKGSIRNPNLLNSQILKEEREGKIFVANNGIKMKIISYRSFKDIDVQFEDGLIVNSKSIHAFERGQIAYPGIKILRGTYVKGVFHNYTLLAVAYRKGNEVYYICEDKYGNKDVLTPQQMMEKSRVKKIF